MKVNRMLQTFKVPTDNNSREIISRISMRYYRCLPHYQRWSSSSALVVLARVLKWLPNLYRSKVNTWKSIIISNRIPPIVIYMIRPLAIRIWLEMSIYLIRLRISNLSRLIRSQPKSCCKSIWSLKRYSKISRISSLLAEIIKIKSISDKSLMTICWLVTIRTVSIPKLAYLWPKPGCLPH